MDRNGAISMWGSVAVQLGWRCLAYCLMDNHVHHVVETPEPDLDVGVRDAHGAYGRYFNDTHDKVGHVFQGRYGSSLAQSPGVVWYFASYVVLNPVRAGMCKRAEDYAWSSHPTVLGRAPGPRWLDVERLLSFYETGDAAPLNRYLQIADAIRVMGAAGFEPATSRV